MLHYTISSPLTKYPIASSNDDDGGAKFNDSVVEQMFTFLNHYSFENTTVPKTDTDNYRIERSTATLLSALGHEQVAYGIRNLVERFMVNEHEQQERGRKFMFYQTNRHTNFGIGRHLEGDWGSGDDCHIWYTTGNYNTVDGGKPVDLPLLSNIYSQDFVTDVLRIVGDAAAATLLPHKHALEFSRLREPSSASFDSTTTATSSLAYNNKNYIVVHNPFSTKRLLSLTFLTDADSMSYPKTRVLVNDQPTVVIQPVFDDHLGFNHQQYHLARTSGVGYVPPGKSTVRLLPLQSTALPFRLLGASILAEEVQDLITIEFAFETDTVPAPIL
jgi:hypothetical protein